MVIGFWVPVRAGGGLGEWEENRWLIRERCCWRTGIRVGDGRRAAPARVSSFIVAVQCGAEDSRRLSGLEVVILRRENFSEVEALLAGRVSHFAPRWR